MTTTTNEAAEQQGLTDAERVMYDLQHSFARDRVRVIAEALAAERRATVERIAKTSFATLERDGVNWIRLDALGEALAAALDDETAR